MTEIGFKWCGLNSCYYLRRSSNAYVVLVIYVDDMLLASLSVKEIKILKSKLSKRFMMKDLGPAKQIIGMKIVRQDGYLKLNQKRYIEKVLNSFNCCFSRRWRDLPLGLEFKHLCCNHDESSKTVCEQAEIEGVPYALQQGV